MLFIDNKFNDPYINLALEEFLICRKSEEICMLWQNAPAIIVGKNQNTMAEINYSYVTAEKIPVVRRLSGGGTVFHDMGNLNFTYIVKNGVFGDYVGFTKTLRDYIKRLGADAEMSGRNDVLVCGRKISGNAQYLYRDRLLHHGTVLISADMARLAGALKPDEGKIKSKGIKSVKSRVANLSEFVDISAEDFRKGFEAAIKKSGDMVDYALSEEELKSVFRLADEKYRTYEWCFGYSPQYSFHKKDRFGAGGIEVFMDIKNGLIEDIRIYGDFFPEGDISELTGKITGAPHSREALSRALDEVWRSNILGGISKDELLSCLL